MRRLVPYLLLVSCAADLPAPDDGTTAGSTGALQDGPPEVIDLGTSTLLLTEGEVVTFTAVVEDPNGSDDVAGVRLEGEAGELYGEMERGPSSRWTVTLSWDDIHQVVPIDFVGEEARTFVARALDTAVREDTATTVLTLTCIGITPAACDGTCIDLDVDSCP